MGPQLRGCSWKLPPCCIFDTPHQQQYKSCKQNQQPTIHSSCASCCCLCRQQPDRHRVRREESLNSLPCHLWSLAADSARNQLSTRSNRAYMRVSVRRRPPPRSALSLGPVRVAICISCGCRCILEYPRMVETKTTSSEATTRVRLCDGAAAHQSRQGALNRLPAIWVPLHRS